MQGAGARTAQTMLGRPGLARALCSVRHPACTTARAVPPPPQVSVSSSFSLQPRRLVHSGHGASPRLARPLNPRLTSQPYASIHAQSPTPSASINTVVAEPPDTTTLPLPDPSLADFSQADAALPQEHLLLYPAAVSEEEEEELLAELLKPLGRDRYSTHHWDEAIVHYREMYRSRWRRPRNVATVARLRRLAVAADPHVQLSPPVHVLDLAADGIIRAHTDSLRFCGDIVAGLSLLSDAVMTFRSADPASTSEVHALLPRRSMYVMRKDLRYKYTHEVPVRNTPASDDSGGPPLLWKGRPVCKDRRISLIFREEPGMPAATDVNTAPEPSQHPYS